jgi:hypothetical protein
VHSYWDDFFALRGFKDATSLAVAVGDDARATSFAAVRDAFRKDLYTSIDTVMAERTIDYIPGSVELADFDPTSTAIEVTLVDELANLPQDALRRTFDQFFAHVQARRQRDAGDEGYTPYEVRAVGALVLMGQRERAHQLLNALLADQRPAAWHEWAEIVWRDPETPRFIGDMPHTWVGSTFIETVRDMCVYERESDHALVLAAGIPADWVASEEGLTLKRLPTHYGVLHYTLRSAGPDALQMRLWGDLTLPPGRIVVQPPLPRPLTAVSVNGAAVDTFTATSATIGEFPAEVVLTYGPPPASPAIPTTPTP